jgi:putative Ca2+/H+ antiporter (TMEM165/GDT1 family)
MRAYDMREIDDRSRVMSVVIDSRFRRVVGKALLYSVAAVLLGLAAKRVFSEETSQVFAYLALAVTLFGFEEGYRRGHLKSDGADSQTREYLWWSYGVAICAATMLLA